MWNDPEMLRWSGYLLDSFQHWIGRELIEGSNSKAAARTLFEAKFVVVSHGLGEDPVFNYANRVALELWGMDWTSFTVMPSRLSAEPMDRAERQVALQRTIDAGLVTGYTGIRITSDGRRFQIHDGVIWNVLDGQGVRIGQAAMFPRWTFV